MAQRVTMAAVARLAGVSPMTVSNVLRGKESVAPELRDRVEAAVAQTGYRLNRTARTLRSGRSGVIGLLAPGATSPFSYYGMLGGLIAQEARTHGLTLVIESPEPGLEAEVAAVERARALEYDGMIITPLALGPEDAPRLPRDFPLVVLGERPAPRGTAHISLPNHAGAFEATTHLLERGARSIALVSGAPSAEEDVLTRRADGYRDALTAWGRGAGSPMLIEVAELTAQAGREAARASVARGERPDAYLGITDGVLLGVLRGLADAGLGVPSDALAIGFDGIPEGEFSIPSLSTICPDHAWIARRAVELLRERMDADDPAELGGLELTAPHRLVARESTRR
ncbi:LacI family DNA-binding transcriptional regulator [Brachybacterium hainanense]|uniref:LacI family DNA-binding transcriptional regulator n=1 Tax=Brachybacterium hainanense TaxID=1541174 RepID=A0ABV6R6G7_9MICO